MPDYRTGFRDGYNAAREDLMGAFGRSYLPVSMEEPMLRSEAPMPANAPVAKKRRPSAYNRRYKAAFKKHAKKYKTKAGKWMKNGFKKAVKAAHAEAKREIKRRASR